jgi:hypothetical protein
MATYFVKGTNYYTVETDDTKTEAEILEIMDNMPLEGGEDSSTKTLVTLDDVDYEITKKSNR